MPKKIEFIESYLKYDASEENFHGSDYVWNDNHGELIRCKDCAKASCLETENGNKIYICDSATTAHYSDWFCADGVKKT